MCLYVNIRKYSYRQKGNVSMSEKTLSDIQREVDDYISQFKEGYFSPLALMARMSEEVGELAREVNHFYGEKPKKADEADNSVEMELGDILFILSCFANSLNIDLTEAHNKVMHKFATRDANRWTKKITEL
jgi:NTP pyrophosphatase (non-canonical NTP hydrolase)